MARGEARTRICETAVRLFNEQGYDAVSLRTIAAEAGTTIGNLTYHFAHKEDLLVAILSDLHTGFSEQLDRSLQGAELLSHLVCLITQNERNQKAYPFYFDNLSQLMATFPTLQEENDDFQRDIFGYYVWALAELARTGWLALRDDGSVRATAYAMVVMQASWVQASSPYQNELLPKVALSRVLLTLLREHVTDEYLAEFDTVCAASA